MEELVSCILSQHTSDINSFPAFTRLVEKYPDWDDLAATPVNEVAQVIQNAGLANQKAKGIKACLEEIKKKNGSYDLSFLRSLPMPEARKWLESLPWVGPKTASIVLAFSFGMPAIPVDTHIFRVSKRLGLLTEAATEAKAHDELLIVVPEKCAFRFHCLLIEHGRKTCRARSPQCEMCVLKNDCPSAQLNSTKPNSAGEIAVRQKSAKKRQNTRII
jgi:endonuclease-3